MKALALLAMLLVGLGPTLMHVHLIAEVHHFCAEHGAFEHDGHSGEDAQDESVVSVAFAQPLASLPQAWDSQDAVPREQAASENAPPTRLPEAHEPCQAPLAGLTAAKNSTATTLVPTVTQHQLGTEWSRRSATVLTERLWLLAPKTSPPRV